MRVRNVYSGIKKSGCMHRFLPIYKVIFILILIITSGRISSQDLPLYDEISIFMEVPGIGGGIFLLLVLKQFQDLLLILTQSMKSADRITTLFIRIKHIKSIRVTLSVQNPIFIFIPHISERFSDSNAYSTSGVFQ
jgi:hypothetical protein